MPLIGFSDPAVRHPGSQCLFKKLKPQLIKTVFCVVIAGINVLSIWHYTESMIF